MKRFYAGFISACVVAASVLTLGASLAQAQYGPPPDRNLYSAHWVSGLIEQVHQDLNRTYAMWQFSGSDRHNLDHAEEELRDFAVRWDRGRFNRGELDHAMGAIQRVVEKNHMPPGNRETLIDDLGRLRAMRDAYDRHQIGAYR